MNTTPILSAALGQTQTAEAAIANTKTWEFGQSRIPLTTVEMLVVSVAQDAAQANAVAKLLANLLSSDATFDAKQFACRQLAIIGGPENVPAIAPLLNDPKTADIARYALEPIQGEAADRAFIHALQTAPAETHLGIINSLGQRRSERAVPVLAGLAGGREDSKANAAIAALGRIGSPGAASALAHLKRNPAPARQHKIEDALLACADHISCSRPAKSRHIYADLAGSTHAPVKKAAELKVNS